MYCFIYFCQDLQYKVDIKDAFCRISSKQLLHNLFTKITKGEKKNSFRITMIENMSHTEKIIYFLEWSKVWGITTKEKINFVSKSSPVKKNGMVTWCSFFSPLFLLFGAFRKGFSGIVTCFCFPSISLFAKGTCPGPLMFVLWHCSQQSSYIDGHFSLRSYSACFIKKSELFFPLDSILFL